MDISNPQPITPAGCFGSTGITHQIVVVNNRIFANNFRPMLVEAIGYQDICSGTYFSELNQSGDLIILDATDPALLTEISRIANPDHATRVSVSGDLAVCASEMYGGIMLTRISNSDTVNFLSMTQVPGNPQAAVVQGNYAYIASMHEGLIIMDITDPVNPLTIGQYDTLDRAMDVALFGDYALIADGNAGLSIIDVSDPTKPAFVSTFDTPGFGLQVEISGEYAFLSDREDGLKIFDISYPYHPVLVTTYYIAGGHWCTYLAISGNILCLSAANAKLEFLDVSNPEDPRLMSEYLGSHTMYGAAMDGALALIAYGWYGIEVVDITDIDTPVCVASFDTPSFAYDIAINDNYLFVADYFSLIRFLRPSVSDINEDDEQSLMIPNNIRLYANYPNPFNSSTIIEYYIPSRSDVSLEVFNLLGQSVALLAYDAVEPGLHQIKYKPMWRNHELSSGIYIYSLRVGEKKISRKMIFVK